MDDENLEIGVTGEHVVRAKQHVAAMIRLRAESASEPLAYHAIPTAVREALTDALDGESVEERFTRLAALLVAFTLYGYQMTELWADAQGRRLTLEQVEQAVAMFESDDLA
jgi:hypothetical protein